MFKQIKRLFKHFFAWKIDFYYKVLSDNPPQNRPVLFQPTLFTGKGDIKIGKDSSFGYREAPDLFTSYSHIATRTVDASITIGNNTHINNNAALIASHAKISIGNNCLIGTDFQCYTTDFHSLNPYDRNNENLQTFKNISIGNNVFIGNNVIILKGVSLGDGCNVGIGSVVTKSFPAGCTIAGNPAILIKKI